MYSEFWLFSNYWLLHIAGFQPFPETHTSFVMEPAGTGSWGDIPLKPGGRAQSQRKGDGSAGGGCPETAGQPDQTPRDHQLPDLTARAAAQQQDCRP